MSDETVLENLLDQWERAYRSHQSIELSDLCRDYPQLLEEVTRRVHAIRAVENVLHQHDAVTLQGNAQSASDSEEVMPDNAVVQMGARYQLVRHHAGGGLGEIILARDAQIGRSVAIKRMLATRKSDAAARSRFLREAEITGQLDHPGVVPMLTVGTDQTGAPCYAMKFVEGETLAAAVRAAFERFEKSHAGRSNRTEFQRSVLRPLLTRFVTVCNTVAYAHGQGVVHRDLKPGNIMLGAYGATYVVDWGLAKRMTPQTGHASVVTAHASTPDDARRTHDPEETLRSQDVSTDVEDDDAFQHSLTQTGAIAGTPAYMSPEQASGQTRNAGIASDIYSLGATLYFILTCKSPVVTDSELNWLTQLKSGSFSRPSVINPLIPPSLEAICLKAMALQPDGRYTSALELAADLERWMADEPVSVHSESLPDRLARWSRRHRAWTQAGVLSLAIITLLTVIFAIQLNQWRQNAETASQKNEQLAREKSALADEKTELAAQEAAAKRTADEQGNLALSTLRSVIFRVSRNLRDIEGAAEVRTQLLNTAIKGLEKVAKTLDTRIGVDKNLMIAHSDIGKIYMAVGTLDNVNTTEEALRHFQKSAEIGEQLAPDYAADGSIERNLSIAYELVGDAFLQQGNLEGADRAYANSLAISERCLRNDPTDTQRRQDTGFGYEKVGDILLARGNRTEAAKHYQRSLEIYAQLVKDEPEIVSNQRDLLVARSKMGNIQRQEGQLVEAAQTFRDCIAVCEALEKLPNSGAQRRDRSVMLNKLGAVLDEQSDFAGAEEAFAAGLQIARDTVKATPQSATARRDLAVSLRLVGDMKKKLTAHAEARKLFLESADIRRALANEDISNKVAQVDLATILTDIADLDLLEGNPDPARSLLAEAETILKTLEDAGKLEAVDDQKVKERVIELQAKLPPQ